MDDVEYDSSVEAAWRTFRIELADRLAQLTRDDDIEIVQSTDELPDGPHGRLTFSLTGARRVRCAIVAADMHPTEECRLDQIRRLLSAGWRPLRGSGGRFIVESGRRGVDALALQAETALREIWEVLHPTFLVGADTSAPEETEIAVGVMVRSAGQLRALAVEALTGTVDREIVVDSDGDIQIPAGKIGSWLRVCEDEPHLEFFACIVDELPDVAGAAMYLATNAARWPSLGLRLIETRMYATLRVGCATFHRANLIAALRTWLEFIGDDVPEISGAMAALAPSTPEIPAGEIPAALMRLHHLARYGPPPGPIQVMVLCDDDRSRALGFIKLCVAQSKILTAAAQRAGDDGDVDEVKACRDEQTAWRETMLLITRALKATARRGSRARDTPPDQGRPPTG